MNERSGAKRAVQSKQMNERCKQMSEWMSEWPSSSVSLFGCAEPWWGGNRKALVAIEKKEWVTPCRPHDMVGIGGHGNNC